MCSDDPRHPLISSAQDVINQLLHGDGGASQSVIAKVNTAQNIVQESA